MTNTMTKHLLSMLCVLLSLGAFAFTPTNSDNNPGGSVKGRIVSSDGQPVAFVTVSLAGANLSVNADEDGGFELLNVRPGSYELQVSASGMTSKTVQVKVEAGKPASLNIVMNQKAVELEDVIVNARRSINQKIIRAGKAGIAPMDLPQGIAVVDASMLKEQQAQRLSDAIRNVNGVAMAGQRASTQETFYARGYNLGSSNYFKNGSRMNSGAMPEMSGLESVEVLKGSAAILYGNVAPGGIINLVTKKPKFSFGGEASLRAGSFGLIKPAVDVYGPLSKNVAYRINTTYESANSYRDEVSSERFYVNPSFLFKLNKKTELVVEADYLHHDFTPDFGIGSLDNTIITPVDRNTFFGTSWQYAKTRQASASASLRHELSDKWQLNTVASYQRYSRDYFSAERIQAKADGDWTRPLGKTLTGQHYGVVTTDITGEFNTGKIGHKLLVGVDADYYKDDNTRFNNPTTYDVINLLDPEKYTPRTDMPETEKTFTTQIATQRFGAYVQDLVSLSSNLKLLVGARWSTQAVGKPDSTYHSSGMQVKTTEDNVVNSAFSPRAGLVYRPTTNTSIYASYANSFVINNGTDVYGELLDPSIIDQYEIGVKNDLLQGKLSVNLSAYRIINNNLSQTAPFLPDGTENNNTSLKELTGQTTSDGVELDLMAYPAKGLRLMGGYAWNYMRYTSTPESKGSYIEGERLVNSPAHTANLSAFYTLQQGALKGLKLGAQAFYTGNRVAGWNNTKGQSQSYDRRIAVDGFTTIDLTAGYTLGNWSALVKLSNLTNTFNYYVHENYSVNPIAPRQVVGTLAYRF